MDITTIITELRTERNRIDAAITAITALNSTGQRRGRPAINPSTPNRSRRTMSVASRARIAAAQRARWAKVKQAKTSKPARHGMSKAARARIAAAQRRRWAKVKALQKKAA